LGVVVEAPATSANLGSGFDIFALALAGPKDRLVLERAASKIALKVDGQVELKEDTLSNVISAVTAVMMTEFRLRGGLSMRLTKGVPVGVGLGSSAASSVAAAAGINRLFGLGLSGKEILGYAGVGEKAASGTAHYDNVAASLAGGFVVVGWDHSYIRIEPPKSMALCLVTPQRKLPKQKTKFARSLLRREVSLERAVAVTRAASMMVHGFMAGSLEEIGDAMSVSFVDERRSVMIPAYERVRRAAISSGASGVCISGAGPTLLAVCKRSLSDSVLRGMIKEFRGRGVKSSGFVSRPGDGCRIVER
jgi:homoserine kinase